MKLTLRIKDREWLRRIAGSAIGMYPGMRQRDVPVPVASRLRKMRLIEEFAPHNPVHDSRYVATEAGRRALEET